jgi:hypothetical protein
MLYSADVSAVHSVSTVLSLPVHPGNDCSAKEEDDWWRQADAAVDATDSAYFLVGAMPPRLAYLKQRDLSGYTRVAVPVATEKGYLHSMDHNRKVDEAVAQNETRKAQIDDIQLRVSIALARAMDSSLRPNAASLLFSLQAAYPNAALTAARGYPVHNGHAMFNELRKRKSTSRPSRVRSAEYHEDQYSLMRSTRLPDGCSSQDFADKCNMLVSDHLPYFQTVKLEGANLVDAFISFLPEALAGDGRDIKDRLEDDKKSTDTALALERLTRRVARAADPALENARLALSMAPADLTTKIAAVMHTPGSGAAIAAATASKAAAAQSPQPPLAPAAGSATAPATKQQVQQWIAQALAAVDAPADAQKKAAAKKGAGGKAKERGGRLPEGTWCKSGSCQYRHDEKFPNKPCYRFPGWDGGAEGLDHEIVSNPPRLARLLEDREKAGVRLGMTVKKLKYATAPAPAAAMTCSGCDGLDDWAGGHASVSLGSFSSSPVTPCCPLAHAAAGASSHAAHVPIPAGLLEAQGLDDAELAALDEHDRSCNEVLSSSGASSDASRSTSPTPDHMRTHDAPNVAVGDPLGSPTWYFVSGTPMHGTHAVTTSHDYDLLAACCARANAFPRRCGTGDAGYRVALQHLTSEGAAEHEGAAERRELCHLWWLCEDEERHRRAVISTVSQRSEEDLSHTWPALRCFGSGSEAETRAHAALEASRVTDVETLRPPVRDAVDGVSGVGGGLYPPGCRVQVNAH